MRKANKYGFYHDYTKSMMMKMFMARPDLKGGSTILISCEQALDIIKKMDNITQGIHKIVYLVGWQYNGHDDKFPDCFEVNEGIKRASDTNALDSLLWLIEEGAKYNTVVSVHINFNDAYEDSPSFPTLVANNALIRGKNGKPFPIENYNNKDCYKVSFKEDYESGEFQKRFDRLLDMLPLAKLQTIHVDNLVAFSNICPEISTKEMQKYRSKIIEYVHNKGIDITSEFTYREDGRVNDKENSLMNHTTKAPNDCLGKIPASWWFSSMTREEVISVPPELYTGGIFNCGNFGKYLYGNMHGEDIWMNKKYGVNNWIDEFIYQFSTIQVPYNYLCQYQRKAIKGNGITERCIFSDNLVSYKYNGRIKKDGCILKKKEDILIPLAHKSNTLWAYSHTGCNKEWKITYTTCTTAKVYKVTENGNEFISNVQIQNNKILLDLKAKQAYIVELL